MEKQYKEAILEYSKTKLEESKASLMMAYYLFMQKIDLEDQVGCNN